MYEPWHYRYVGRDVAAKVRASGLTLREYLWRQQEWPAPTPTHPDPDTDADAHPDPDAARRGIGPAGQRIVTVSEPVSAAWFVLVRDSTTAGSHV